MYVLFTFVLPLFFFTCWFARHCRQSAFRALRRGIWARLENSNKRRSKFAASQTAAQAESSGTEYLHFQH